MAAAQTEAEIEKATPMSKPAPPPKPIELPVTKEIDDGLKEIAKQLVDLTDYLPLIKQCMKDVKSGYYTTQVAAHI